MKKIQERGTEVSCYTALKREIRHIQEEPLADIHVSQGQQSLALNSQKMEEGKSLAQGNAPRKGQEGSARNSNLPRATQGSLADETGNKELS